MTAVNICYGEERRRGGLLSLNLHALALGAGLVLFANVAFALIAVLSAAFALLPVSGGWLQILGLVRWPILAGVIIVVLGIVYRYASDRAEAKPRWISWGSMAATALYLWFHRLHHLRLEGRKLRQDLRLAWRRDHSAALVLSDRLRHPRRSGIECGDRGSDHASEARSFTAALGRSIIAGIEARQVREESGATFSRRADNEDHFWLRDRPHYISSANEQDKQKRSAI
jgi:Virulence factor BrkB